MQLSESEQRHLLAAEGWLELGLTSDAAEELESIPADKREHPDVLKVQWEVCRQLKQWELCVQGGAALVKLQPDDAQGWIHRSFALHELRRTKEAYDLLLPALETFPAETTIPYNLACYSAQLGEHERAFEFLDTAFIRAGKRANEMKLQALDDPDLEPIWIEIAAD